MTFDPNLPFDVVDEPRFDPASSFEVVQPSQETVTPPRPSISRTVREAEVGGRGQLLSKDIEPPVVQPSLFSVSDNLTERQKIRIAGAMIATPNERAIMVDTLLDQLLEKHSGWDNFHNEPPVADLIASYVHEQSDILQNNVDKLVKVMLMCRIGRDVSYCDGVSPRGRAYYEHILSLLGDK